MFSTTASSGQKINDKGYVKKGTHGTKAPCCKKFVKSCIPFS